MAKRRLSKSDPAVSPIGEDDLVRLPLYDEVFACRACPIREEARWPIPPEGARGSTTLVVGQNPGREEEEAKRIFIGPSGQELNGWLRVLGVDRAKVALMNSVACRTAKNRTPRVGETRGCASRWAPRVVAAMPNLSVVLLLGRPAQAALLPKFTAPLLEMVAARADYDGRAFWVYPLVHPAYILRSPNERPRQHGVLREVRDHWRRVAPEAYAAVRIGG